jgi:hypothetical protein
METHLTDSGPAVAAKAGCAAQLPPSAYCARAPVALGWWPVGGQSKMRKLGLIFTVAVVGAATPAFSACSEPAAPYCSTKYGPFDDEDEFHRCKSEMESYQSEAQDFVSCMKRKSDSIIQEYNNAVDSFNRRARG